MLTNLVAAKRSILQNRMGDDLHKSISEVALLSSQIFLGVHRKPDITFRHGRQFPNSTVFWNAKINFSRKRNNQTWVMRTTLIAKKAWPCGHSWSIVPPMEQNEGIGKPFLAGRVRAPRLHVRLTSLHLFTHGNSWFGVSVSLLQVFITCARGGGLSQLVLTTWSYLLCNLHGSLDMAIHMEYILGMKCR